MSCLTAGAWGLQLKVIGGYEPFMPLICILFHLLHTLYMDQYLDSSGFPFFFFSRSYRV